VTYGGAVIDLHSHVLHSFDDGARDPEESLAMARAAAEDGTTVLAATPHVRDDYPTMPQAMEAGLAELRSAINDEGIPIQVTNGAEIALDRLSNLGESELRRFTLGRGRHVLIETPYLGWPLDLGDHLFELTLSGFLPVLAHPERNQDVQLEPELLRPLVEGGVLVQITAASLDGRFGRGPQEAARKLVSLELVHLVASDAHDLSLRKPGLASAVSTLDDDELARWLTHDVPAAILDGTELPRRPQRTRRRFGLTLHPFARRRSRETVEHA
jgi:protein-tyrosine phosphatase